MASAPWPVATYRLQFHAGFRFKDARRLVPYLHGLGITTLYASPVFRARSGSVHGYDVTHPTQVNPELGGLRGLRVLSRELKRYGMGLILDIVPNHMAASPENPWWANILEYGHVSPYARFFDINWSSRVAPGRVLLPVLGKPYLESLESRELSLQLTDGVLSLHYFDRIFPVNVGAWAILARQDLQDSLPLDSIAGWRELQALAGEVDRVRGDRGAPAQVYRSRRSLKRRIAVLLQENPKVREPVGAALAQVNRDAGFGALDELLRRQAYRLAFWPTGCRRIAYRRFFDISDLAGLRVEDPAVFKAFHSLLFRLAEDGMVSGRPRGPH